MADNNKSETKVDNENIDSVKNDVENTDSKNGEAENANSDNKSVPLPTFLDMKSKVKDLSEKLESFENEKRKAEEAKLAEEGKLKELLEKKEAELEKLKSDYEPDALAYREILNQERESAKEVLGDDFTDEEIEVMPLQTLRKLVKKVSVKPTPETDGGGGNPPTQLTESEKAEAKRMGLSDDAYKRFKEKRKELKGE